MSVIRKTVLALLTVALLWGGHPVARAAHPWAAPLAEGLLYCAETVDLSEETVTAEELCAVYAALLQDSPELFHVAPRLSFTLREETERWVGEVYPVYTLSGEELVAARRFYRDALTAILAEMDAAFGGRTPTEAETVVYLHDYLAAHYAYDTRALEDGKDFPNADAYTFLRDGVGICQAYALTFLALARGAGLEADFVASAAMDHAWNHVRVDGAWYHVDVTRDDPIPALPGEEAVNHTRLLRSDGGMAALGYHGFSCSGGHACTDTRFEAEGSAVTEKLHTPLIPFGEGFLGEDGRGVPVAVTVTADGFSAGQEGDVDGDKALTPADLLAVYGDGYPAPWRDALREALVAP